MKYFPLLFGLLLGFAACRQDAKTGQAASDEASAATESPNTNASPGLSSGQGELQLSCESLTDPNADGAPRSAVYAIAGERKTKIMEIEAACMQLQTDSYASYGIPADATAALGSWFAGIGDFFYAKKEGTQINIYHSSIDEQGPPGGIHTYYKVATYENGKITLIEIQ